MHRFTGWTAVMGLVGLSLLNVSCSKDNRPTSRLHGPAVHPLITPVPTQPAPQDARGTEAYSLENIDPLTGEASLSYFKMQCASCHDAKTGSNKSFFSIDQESFTLASIGTTSIGPTAYYTIFLKAWQIEAKGSPLPMPPGQSTDEDRLEAKRLMRWFELNMPDLVIASSKKYEFQTTLNKTKTVTTYVCTNPVSFRQFMSRVTSDAFDRLPKTAELGDNPDRPVSQNDRQAIAKKISSDPIWREEFLNVGLRKFARKLSGSGQITASGTDISQPQAVDLQDEFYQLLLRDLDSKSFKEILLTDSLRVSANTAGYYGCGRPSAGWADCTLVPKRKSYFGSMSFLKSTPSSFLQENNNYKRVAMMQFIVQGDVILAATDGPAGDGVINPLPACLKTVDYRGVLQTSGSIAPFGTAAIPAHGNLCQSCHIDRYLAAGSMLFRPFNKIGLMFNSKEELNIKNDSDFLTATQPDHINKVNGVRAILNESFLTNLLTSTNERVCVTTPTGEKNLTSVADFAGHLIGDGQVLAAGLAKHLPRAFSNLNFTNEEIVKKVSEAYVTGGGKLGPMIESYFASETYSCGRKN